MATTKKTILHSAVQTIIVMACLLMPAMCSAQSDAWTWMSGSEQIDEAGVYGTQGTPNAANTPGARYDSCSWIDSSGDLWLFGGIDDSYGLLNDLWHYDNDTGWWTWMSGASVPDQPGTYGIKGVAGAANTPGSRGGAVCWIDEDDNLWLYGGDGFNSNGYVGWLNDMWRYDTATSEWTWVYGSSVYNIYEEKGIHDDKGYPQPYVRPGAREGAIGWTDSFGFMWMFGGFGWQDLEYFEKNDEEYCWEDADPDCPDPGALNDLWVYNKATNEWAWVSGSDNVGQNGAYGTMGAATFANMPGGRMGSIGWIDEDNNVWLFGGVGKDSNVPEGFWRRMNDLWRYDPVTKMWTWMSGSDVGDQIGIYTIDEETAPGAYIVPGCREESISWIDSDGDLWLHGGFGQASTYSPIGGLLNDLWRYDIAENKWNWVSGSDEISNPNDTIIAGVYGTRGVADVANVPGARMGSASWIDSRDELWLFGGFGFDGDGAYGYMNDLWRFGSRTCVFDADCDDGLYCNGDEICLAGRCVEGTEPCSGDTPFCDEDNATCVECLGDSNCDDDLFCNGVENCVDNICVEGTAPCSGDTPVCDETQDLCLACLVDGDCDDGLFCTGEETCEDGVCVDGDEPCTDEEICDETEDICRDCLVDDDCDDGLYCTGVETCVDGICQDGAEPCFGDTPVCDEATDTCQAGCLEDDDCPVFYECQNNVCVPACNLRIKYKAKKMRASKLNKDRKVSFKIYTSEFGEVDMGPDLQILKVKPNTKKGKLKVKALVPAGLPPQVIPVWVGGCYGEIEILDE